MTKPKPKLSDFPAKPTRPHPSVKTYTPGPSLTKQQFKTETNINNLVNAYLKTGEHQNLNKLPPRFDYAPSEDFMASLILVDQAKESFAALPPQLRTRFGNNPAEFLAFAQDSSNRPEMAALGLLSPEATSDYYESLTDDSEPLPGDPEPTGDPTPASDEPE